MTGVVPRVRDIHIAPGARLPMTSVETVVAEAGRGLVGDRYHGARHRHVSVQSRTQLQEAAEIFGAPIEPCATRRNLTLTEGEIPKTPGTLLRIGDVLLEAVRVAAPCKLLDDGIGRGARRRCGAAPARCSGCSKAARSS